MRLIWRQTDTTWAGNTSHAPRMCALACTLRRYTEPSWWGVKVKWSVSVPWVCYHDGTLTYRLFKYKTEKEAKDAAWKWVACRLSDSVRQHPGVFTTEPMPTL